MTQNQSDRTLLKSMAKTLTKEIRPHVRDVLRQLGWWSGEFPASTSDAPPDISPSAVDSPPVDDDDLDASGPVRLTQVERLVMQPDVSRRERRRVGRLIDDLTITLAELCRSVELEVWPAAAPTATARIAWLLHHSQLLADGWPWTDSRSRKVFRAARLTDELARMCSDYRPAPKRTIDRLTPDACHAHQKAGAIEPIAKRYRGKQLCMWCGEFAATHGKYPPKALVKLHDRGIRITPAILRQHRRAPRG